MVINQRSSLPVPFTFSQSSLQDYRDCERRFYLRYIEQLAWPAVDSEPVLENERRKAAGEIFHRLVQVLVGDSEPSALGLGLRQFPVNQGLQHFLF